MQRPQPMATLVGFDAHASRARGLRRIDSSGSSPAACYALDVYAAGRDANAARVITPAELAADCGAIDAATAAEVHRLLVAFVSEPEVA